MGKSAILFYNQAGRGVRLQGLGTYLPDNKQNGRLILSHHMDPLMRSALNAEGEYTGDIINRDDIGKFSDE